ncbi:uncharacterized protein [Rutidosis leptorrhynchoides]|uniref:uncharacterized protein n=1 Tax=Rutidosis leptorrhynchoides TaxID=125765 RepID=UPI003A994846
MGMVTPPRCRTASDLSSLEGKIAAYLPSNDPRDKWIQKFGINHIFTTASLFNILSELSSLNIATQPTIFNRLLPQKISIFIWRASQNKLPVRTELDKRGIDLHSTRCPICDDDIETLRHTLIFL